MKLERIWVDPKFRKKLKVEAASRGMSVSEYTKILSKDEFDCLKRNDEDKKKKSFSFKW